MKSIYAHSSHLVLISPEVTDQLKFPRYRMSKPETVQVAMQSFPESSIILDEYVHLKLSDPSFCWTSRTVRAVITPHLSVPALLGLPFLAHNSIVIDHEAHTVVDKCVRFDLLHPTPRRDTSGLHSPNEKRKTILKDRKAVVRELKTMGVQLHTNDTISPIRAVRTCIETLTAPGALQSLESKLKAEYKDVFEGIPHLNELPDTVYCCIKLKDAEKTITTCSYSTPRKFKEAWLTLR